MLFSRNWIADSVDLPDGAEELATRLTAAGLAVDEVTAHGDDWLLDVDVTTNRPDCMNHLGLAREAALLFDRELKLPPFAPSTGSATAASATAEEAANSGDAAELGRVEIDDAEGCPRYCALIIRGVKVGPSPQWLVDRLEMIGARSINNVVDATNYVLWETGQPQHAFDLAKIPQGDVRIRRARQGETLRTLDGETRELYPEILVIADADQPIALAGIMGGFDSEVTDATTDVLLESAHFDPAIVRAGKKRLAMHTDASHRFERGADPAACLWAARRGAALIAEIAGGEVVDGYLEQSHFPDAWPPRVDIELDRLNGFGGTTISAEEARASLIGLGFSVDAVDAAKPDQWRVTAPSWRWYDFLGAYPADVYEEVLRIHGFDDIASTLPAIGGADASARPAHLRRRKVQDTLAGAGFAEAINYAFLDRDSDVAYPRLGSGDALSLTNPLSERYAVMRRSIAPNLIETALYNLRRGASNVRLFEVGHVFYKLEPTGRVEHDVVGMVLGGEFGTPWERRVEFDFYDLKGVVETVAAQLGVELRFQRADDLPAMRAGAAAHILRDGDIIGYLGQLQDSGAAVDLFVAELLLDRLADGDDGSSTEVPSRFPGIVVDSTLTHVLDISWRQLLEAIHELAPEDLVDVRLVDRYQGDGVPAGAVNTTISFLYNAADRSLTQDEVNSRRQRVADHLEQRFGYQETI